MTLKYKIYLQNSFFYMVYIFKLANNIYIYIYINNKMMVVYHFFKLRYIIFSHLKFFKYF